MPPHAAFALVLGANLGTALNPLLDASLARGRAHALLDQMHAIAEKARHPPDAKMRRLIVFWR